MTLADSAWLEGGGVDRWGVDGGTNEELEEGNDSDSGVGERRDPPSQEIPAIIRNTRAKRRYTTLLEGWGRAPKDGSSVSREQFKARGLVTRVVQEPTALAVAKRRRRSPLPRAHTAHLPKC